MARPTEFRDPPDWVADAVFYQIFPDRFAPSRAVPKPGPLEPWDSPPTRHGFKGGDLIGIVEHLDHLEELGATAIYLNPVFSSASNHRYHAYDYQRVDPLLGGTEALRVLLDAAHARGLRVILDGVFNHCGRGFWPFHHVLETGPSSPYIDWFTVKGWPLHAYDPRRKPNYEAWWGLPALPKLNVRNRGARAYLLDVAERWIRFGADGWRLDVPEEIDDAEFWREFRKRVRSAKSDAYLVGEVWHEAPEWLEGDRFDGLMNYPFARVALGLCVPALDARQRHGSHRLDRLDAKEGLASLTRLASCYRRESVFAQLNLLGSHDTPRFLTLAGGDHSALHLATILQMTLPGAPCIYYGDEVGMEGGPDPDCRRSFPWRRGRWHLPTLELYRRAVGLRRDHRALRRGDFRPLHGRDGVLAFVRGRGADALLVVLNLASSRRAAMLPLPEDLPAAAATEVWAEDAPPPTLVAATSRRRADRRTSLELDVEPRGARVVAFSRRGRHSR